MTPGGGGLRWQRGRGGEESTHVFKAAALVVLQEAVLAAEMAIAETAVADDALGSLLALLCAAANLLAGHFGLAVMGWLLCPREFVGGMGSGDGAGG